MYLFRGVIGRSLNQQTMASSSWVTVGALFGRHNIAPRLTSMSSASRIVTDIGGFASWIEPPYRSIESMVVVSPEGSTSTSSPGRKIPPATCPA